MPKVNHCNIENLGKGRAAQAKKSASRSGATRKALQQDIVTQFGMCLTMANLMVVLGQKDRKCTTRWVTDEGIEPVLVNGRKRYLASDVAKALDSSKLKANTM